MFDRQQPVDAVVVLGGCHASDATMSPAAQLCTSSLFRLVEGLRILEANPQALLFVSGYKGTDNNACRSEEHTSELQSRPHLVCRLLLEKKKKKKIEVNEKYYSIR